MSFCGNGEWGEVKMEGVLLKFELEEASPNWV